MHLDLQSVHSDLQFHRESSSNSATEVPSAAHDGPHGISIDGTSELNVIFRAAGEMRYYVCRPPSHRPFPSECTACGCCGHNLTSHAKWVRMWPEVQHMTLSWQVGWAGIHHGCVWCKHWDYFKPRLSERARLLKD